MSRPRGLHWQIAALFGAATLAGCDGASSVSQAAQSPGLASASQRAGSRPMAHYTIVSLGTLGGTIAAGISIDGDGAVSGLSSLAGDSAFHAALWPAGSTNGVDLQTLGGVNSAVEWPNHDIHEVVGISQTSTADPLGEKWSCSAFIPNTGTTCLGFVWNSGTMAPLSTFGGNNGFASGANSRGDVVGWAENEKHDSSCVPPQVLQFEAAMWTPDGRIHELAPLAGDRDGAATGINDRGDVAGISGICQNAVGALSAKHAVMWHDGVATYLGGLGGAGWNTPTGINNNDEIVGFADRHGDRHATNPNYHAFLWTQGMGMQDLGTLPGDGLSQAYAVNDSGQIVGLSCVTANCSVTRAFIWQNGTMTDLNTLVPSGSPYLVFANDINDNGVITGLALDQNTGAVFAFRAIPNDNGSLSLQPTKSRPIPPARLFVKANGPILRIGAFGKIVP
ncbi:MAG TPA: hypothetical protein VEV38_12365 [Candidatus Eremiobacteraceae bacterium]|nr:hypothetical protein [Candidatus Eremiobacteraceae bacterium]